jgi:hypothetical protein
MAPGGACNPFSIVSSVPASETFPENTSDFLINPLPSITRPSVTKEQSLLFSLERPRAALEEAVAPPSK